MDKSIESTDYEGTNIQEQQRQFRRVELPWNDTPGPDKKIQEDNFLFIESVYKQKQFDDRFKDIQIKIMTQNLHFRPETFFKQDAKVCSGESNFQNIQYRRACEFVSAIKNMVGDQPDILCIQEATDSIANTKLFDGLEKLGYTNIIQKELFEKKFQNKDLDPDRMTFLPDIYKTTYIRNIPGLSISYKKEEYTSIFEDEFTFPGEGIFGYFTDLHKRSGVSGADYLGYKGGVASLLQVPNSKVGNVSADNKRNCILILNVHPSPFVELKGKLANWVMSHSDDFKKVYDIHKNQVTLVRMYIDAFLLYLGIKKGYFTEKANIIADKFSYEYHKYYESIANAGNNLNFSEINLMGVFVTGDMNINRYEGLAGSELEKKFETGANCCSYEFYQMLHRLSCDQPPIVPDVNETRWVHYVPGGTLPPGRGGLYTWDGEINAITQDPLWPKSFQWIDYVLYYHGFGKFDPLFHNSDPVPLYMDNRAIRLKMTKKIPEISKFYTSCVEWRQEQIKELFEVMLHGIRVVSVTKLVKGQERIYEKLEGQMYKMLKSVDATTVEKIKEIFSEVFSKLLDFDINNITDSEDSIKEIYMRMPFNKDRASLKLLLQTKEDFDKIFKYAKMNQSISERKKKDKFAGIDNYNTELCKNNKCIDCNFNYYKNPGTFGSIPNSGQDNPYKLIEDMSDHYAVMSYVILDTPSNRNKMPKDKLPYARLLKFSARRYVDEENSYDIFKYAKIWQKMNLVKPFEKKFDIGIQKPFNLIQNVITKIKKIVSDGAVTWDYVETCVKKIFDIDIKNDRTLKDLEIQLDKIYKLGGENIKKLNDDCIKLISQLDYRAADNFRMNYSTIVHKDNIESFKNSMSTDKGQMMLYQLYRKIRTARKKLVIDVGPEIDKNDPEKINQWLSNLSYLLTINIKIDGLHKGSDKIITVDNIPRNINLYIPALVGQDISYKLIYKNNISRMYGVGKMSKNNYINISLPHDDDIIKKIKECQNYKPGVLGFITPERLSQCGKKNVLIVRFYWRYTDPYNIIDVIAEEDKYNFQEVAEIAVEVVPKK